MDPQLAAVVLLVSAAMHPAQAGPTKLSEVDLFKNYAMSTCVADSYVSNEVVQDAAAAARGYLELGSFPLEAYTKATLLGRTFLRREYRSHSGNQIVLMKCLEFFHSRDLADLARDYSKSSRR